MNINDLPAKALAQGLIGRYAQGKEMTLGYVEIQPGSNLGLHSHPHEQITYMLEGELEMQLGAETITLTAGAYLVIPSGVVHGAVAKSFCRLIDVFSPVREEYK